jgi:hypothetical protein
MKKNKLVLLSNKQILAQARKNRGVKLESVESYLARGGKFVKLRAVGCPLSLSSPMGVGRAYKAAA